MATINVSEDDFRTVASAARDANEAGDREAARKLDKIARKINAALSNANTPSSPYGFGRQSKRLTWQDCPSTLL